MMQTQDKQRGATLFIALIFLVVMSLFGVSAINTSSMNLRIAGNMQFQHQATAAAQMGIDHVLASLANFTAPGAQTVAVDIDRDGTPDYTASVTAPVCTSSQTAKGYSAEYCATGACPLDTNWEVASTVNDTLTGAKVTVTQGVKVRLPGGSTC